MSYAPPEHAPLHNRLAGVVVAFDLDNTLLDPDGNAYDRTVRAFVSLEETGLSEERAFLEYEAVRACGPAIERLGFRNPIHHRGDVGGLAAFCLTRATSHALLGNLKIHPDEQAPCREALERLAVMERATRHGAFTARLTAERAVRRLCRSDEPTQHLRSEIKRLSRHPRIVEWAAVYRTIDQQQPINHDAHALIDALRSSGAVPVVITSGLTAVQGEKLDRAGLSACFARRTLVTEAAAAVPGRAELDARLDKLLSSPNSLLTEGDPLVWHRLPAGENRELAVLWHYHCLIESWSAKTPSFYARCLHAIRSSLDNPERALAEVATVSSDQWRRQPLRFVMIGDRYDLDVRPLAELLGQRCGMTVHLRMGKYAAEFPEDQIPADRQPDRTFTDWDSLAGFLTDTLSADEIGAITTPPRVFPKSTTEHGTVGKWHAQTEGTGMNAPEQWLIEEGQSSPFEAVRTVARLLPTDGGW